MRLFVALEIPHEIQLRLAEGSRALREELPKARWVRADRMHLTLAFLGDTEPALLAELRGGLGRAFAAYPPLALTVTGVGAFPPRGRARVLWAGVEAGGDLAGLQGAVAAAVERATGKHEKRQRGGYHPHVTLARCRSPWPRWAVDKLQDGFGRDHSRLFRVEHGALIESTLGPDGPRYRTVEDFPLRGEA